MVWAMLALLAFGTGLFCIILSGFSCRCLGCRRLRYRCGLGLAWLAQLAHLALFAAGFAPAPALVFSISTSLVLAGIIRILQGGNQRITAESRGIQSNLDSWNDLRCKKAVPVMETFRI